MPTYVIVIIVAVGMVLVIGLMAWAEHRRRQAIATFFASRGDQVWLLAPPEVRAAALDALGDPPELKDGTVGVKWAAEVKSSARPTWVMEHSYSRGSGKSKRTYTHVFAGTQVPAGWATTTITRATLWNKLAELVGKKDMQLDSEAFNTAFRVSTDDENFALVFLTPAVQAWLLAAPKDWTVRVTQGRLQVFMARSADVKSLQALCEAPAQLLTLTTPELHSV